MDRLQTKLRRLGIDLNIEVKILNSSERKHGSDFIVFLDSKVGSVNIRKGMLVQAKKLSSNWPVGQGDGKYEAYNSEQPRKMLDVTSSSFYLLYNPPTVAVGGGLDNDVGMQVVAASSVAAVAGNDPPSYAALRKHMLPFPRFMVDYFVQTAVGDPRLILKQQPKGWSINRDEIEYDPRPPGEKANAISSLEFTAQQGETSPSLRDTALFR